MADPARQLERILANRGRRERDFGVSQFIERIDASVRRTDKRMGLLIAAWEKTIPPEISVHTRLSTLRQGTLEVQVDSAPMRYELDRFLRAGGEHALRKAYRGTLRRIRVKVVGDFSAGGSR